MPWGVVARTSVEYEGTDHRLAQEAGGLVVINADGDRLEVGNYAEAGETVLVIKLMPGCQTYEARAYHGDAFSECDLAATAIAAAIGGHPDAEADRAGTALSAIWSHHLAIVGEDDPRRVAETYAPTETKTIAHRVQHMAAVGVRVIGCD